MRMVYPYLGRTLLLFICLTLVGSTCTFAAEKGNHPKKQANQRMVVTREHSGKGPDTFDLAKALADGGSCVSICTPSSKTCYADCICSGTMSCCGTSCTDCCKPAS
jgi:hypothetical protein